MKQIFVFTAGNSAARQHLADSIINPVKEEILTQHVPKELEDKIPDFKAKAGGIYAWGAEPGPQNQTRWEAMQAGDVVLCVYENAYHFVAEVLGKVESKALAKAIWGINEESQQTWQLMYFLTKPQVVEVALDKVEQWLNSRYMGFFRIGDEKVEKIITQFGSVENFIAKKFKTPSPPQDPLQDFLAIMRCYQQEQIVFQSSVQGQRYAVATVNDSGCEIRRLDANQVEPCTKSYLSGKIDQVRRNSGSIAFDFDFDSHIARKMALLQARVFALTPDKKTLLLIDNETQALDAFVEILKQLRVDESSGEPKLYKPAMVACVIEGIASGELKENKITFDWLAPKFIEKLASLGQTVGEKEAAMPFFHLTSDLFWMLSYKDLKNLMEGGSEGPKAIRDKVNHAKIKDTFWPLLQSAANRERLLQTLAEKWWPNSENSTGTKMKELLNQIYARIAANGMVFSREDIENFFCCLRTKPFVLLAGISGTGKSKLVRLFAEAIGATTENHRFKLIPVRPDWNDNADLIGYFDLEGKFQPGALVPTLIRAQTNPQQPFFLCLDEMNLARVEHYFSDFLSIIESRRWKEAAEGKRVQTDPILTLNQLTSLQQSASLEEEVKAALPALIAAHPTGLSFPDNLFVVGTVNMDETTHPFSRKVLDRANAIELSDIQLMNGIEESVASTRLEPIALTNEQLRGEFIAMPDLAKANLALATATAKRLTEINAILRRGGFEIGYRVRDEAGFYLHYAGTLGIKNGRAWERVVLQKILPRIQGSSDLVKQALIELLGEFGGKTDPTGDHFREELKDLSESDSPIQRKLAQMLLRYEADGFTSYWAS